MSFVAFAFAYARYGHRCKAAHQRLLDWQAGRLRLDVHTFHSSNERFRLAGSIGGAAFCILWCAWAVRNWWIENAGDYLMFNFLASGFGVLALLLAVMVNIEKLKSKRSDSPSLIDFEGITLLSGTTFLWSRLEEV